MVKWREFLTQEKFTCAKLKKARGWSNDFEKCPTYGYVSTDRFGQPRDAVLAELSYQFSRQMYRLHFVFERMENSGEPERAIHLMYFNEELLHTLHLLDSIENRGSLFVKHKEEQSL